MEHVPLGSSGLRVSRLGYECVSLSGHPRDEEHAGAMLRHALELGITFFDTGDRFGQDHNERLVGRFLGGDADEVVLATTLGSVGDPTDPRGADGERGIKGRPEHIRAACDASLRRLHVDVIDLYYLHRPDATVPIEETVGTVAELVEAGKVRALGLADVAPETIRRAHAVHPVAALRAEMSLLSRDSESDPLRLCRELGITFVAYRPLGAGYLTDRFCARANRTAKGGLPGGNRDTGRDARLTARRYARLTARLFGLAKPLGCTPGQLALAWVLARGPDVVPVPGTRSFDHLEENVAATHIELGALPLRALDTVFADDPPYDDNAPAGAATCPRQLAVLNGCGDG